MKFGTTTPISVSKGTERKDDTRDTALWLYGGNVPRVSPDGVTKYRFGRVPAAVFLSSSVEKYASDSIIFM